MRLARWGIAITVLATLGCAGSRLEEGVFHSARGYRVAVPGPDWMVANDDRTELTLRNRTVPAAMLAHATCGNAPSRTPLPTLTFQLVASLRDRTVLERGDGALDGLPAQHTILEGRPGPDAEPVRVETWVARDPRCIYDLAYAASPAIFDTWRPDFQRFVETFTRTP